MNSLSQLIAQGVPAMRTTYWGKDTPCTHCCPVQNLSREYNNIYGTITNTHMDIFSVGGEYQAIITGSLISNQREWSKFMCSKIYLGVEFPMPFIEWIEIHGWEMKLTVVNGQVACAVKPIEVPSED